MIPGLLLVFFVDGRIGEKVSSSPPCAGACAASEPSIFGNIAFLGDFSTLAVADFPFVGVLAGLAGLTIVEVDEEDGGMVVAVVLGMVELFELKVEDAGAARVGVSFADSLPSSFIFLSVPRFLIESILVLVLFSFTV